MTRERDIIVDGISYNVVISDEQEALLTAQAAGRAFVAVWKEAGEAADWLWGADYVVGSPETADDRLLERVVRRRLRLPWIIAESDRICIREFTAGDAAQIFSGEMSGEEAVFADPDRLQAYIENQYSFYEYGIWAVERRSDGQILGAAGVSDCIVRRWGTDDSEAEPAGMPAEEMQLELGYHIFGPYRRQGYAEEACRLILEYVEQEYGCPVWAAVSAENTASVQLLGKLGFHLCRSCGEPGTGAENVGEPCATAQKCSGSAPPPCLYVRNWR